MFPQVTVDSSGNALAVWLQDDGVHTNIWANRYLVGNGWGTPNVLETTAFDAGLPDVAGEANGNAMAVWGQTDGTRYNIWANRFVVGTGWGTATLIETVNTADALQPRVAVEPRGNAVAVWDMSDGTRSNIWANYYAAGTGWGTAALIETDNSTYARSPQVAVSPKGDAIALWFQGAGVGSTILYNEYVADVGWGAGGVTVADRPQSVGDVALAQNNGADATCVWSEWGGGRFDTWSSHFSRGSWERAELIEADNAGSVSNPHVAMDASGNAFAVWQQGDGTRDNILANRYVAGAGWGRAGLIETDGVFAASPQVAMNAKGDAMAAYFQNDGFRENVWANRFAAPDTVAPSLSLSLPLDGASTNVSSTWVAGLTEPGAAVSVDGYAAAVAPSGAFGLLIPLQRGANIVTVTATDASGNSIMGSVTITFTDPLPGVQQQLAIAQSALSAAQTQASALAAQVNALGSELTVAQTNLTAAQDRLDTLAANASTTQAELTTARGDLGAAQARVTALETSMTATRSQLAEAQSQLTAARADINATKAQPPSTGGAGTATDAQVASAQTTGLLGVLLGVIGIAVGVAGMMMGRRSMASKTAPALSEAPPPPAKEPPK